MTRIPQRYRIIQFMIENGGHITRLQAAQHLGCYELASRIGELRDEGARIAVKMHTGQNRYGDPVRFARYTLRWWPSTFAIAFKHTTGTPLPAQPGGWWYRPNPDADQPNANTPILERMT